MATETEFHFIDVFARRPLEGNPLTLVPDADHLDVATMRAIAREFNQSETTFLVQSTSAAHWRLRSFTPTGVEVLGAGHNALGAWLWLAHAQRLPRSTSPTRLIQQIGDRLLPVEVTEDADGRTVVRMEQSAPVFGPELTDRRQLAAALNINVADLSDEPAEVVSTGAAHLLVPLRSREAVDRADPDGQRLSSVLRTVTEEGCYLYSLDPVDAAGGSIAYARFFNPTAGISEDPATGTAAGPLAARLVRDGRHDAGTTAIIEQGHRLGRPSRLQVTLSGETVVLSGAGVVVASGRLHL